MKSIYLQKMKTVLTALSLTSKRSLAYVCLGFMGCASAFAQANTEMGTKALGEVTTKIAAYVPYE